MNELTEFERAVLDAILEGDHPTLDILRAQARRMVLESREFSGAGFFLDFVVPEELAAPIPDAVIGDVTAEIPGLRHGAGFLLFIRNGRISFLEGFSYGEDWPPEVTGYTLNRDPALRKKDPFGND